MGGRYRPCVGPKRNEFQRWRDADWTNEYGEFDESVRAANKPREIAEAEIILGLMERFNYPNLAAVYAEDGAILRLLEAESYGYKQDEKEKLEEMQREAEARSV